MHKHTDLLPNDNIWHALLGLCLNSRHIRNTVALTAHTVALNTHLSFVQSNNLGCTSQSKYCKNRYSRQFVGWQQYNCPFKVSTLGIYNDLHVVRPFFQGGCVSFLGTIYGASKVYLPNIDKCKECYSEDIIQN